jgi:hypothetical protein
MICWTILPLLVANFLLVPASVPMVLGKCLDLFVTVEATFLFDKANPHPMFVGHRRQVI